MRHVTTTMLALTALGIPLWAQTGPGEQDAIAALMQKVEGLQRQTLELQQKVRALEAGKNATPAAAETAPQASDPAQTAPVPASAPPSAQEPSSFHDLHGIQWRGFGEVDYKVLDQRKPELGTSGFVPGSAGNFFTGDLALFLNSRLTERSSVLAEIVFPEGDAQGYSVDLRRVLLMYDLSDHLRMAFGRYQTGIGYYNYAFRSAAWLQTTSDRPLVMEFARNGGLLPTQAVGVSITGLIPSGKFGLNYLAEYGSSDTIRPDINGDGTVNYENNSNHVLLGLFARPDWARGLQAGASFYHDKISNTEVVSAERLGQTILNAYVVYTAHRLELLNEGFLIRHSQLHGPDLFNMPAFYAQLSRAFGPVRPFVRYNT